jgi:hypothetical protein
MQTTEPDGPLRPQKLKNSKTQKLKNSKTPKVLRPNFGNAELMFFSNVWECWQSRVTELTALRRQMMSNEAKKGVHSGSNLSVGPSDKSACGEDLSKTASRSRHTGLKKQYKDPFAQTGPSIIEVDDATNAINVPQGARIFGTNDQPSIKTLVEQVLGVTPNSGEHNLQNVKWAAQINLCERVGNC